MATQHLTSPDDQTVTFVELFFDLVFVFSVTQVVGLLHDGLSWLAVGQAILVFWLVWWAWTQFTWSLNAADTTHSWVQISTLTATAVAFFMAVALPQAFGESAMWFAVTYIMVRMIGLFLQYWVGTESSALRSAVTTWILFSTGGLVAVLIGGYLGGRLQIWFWAAAILLDVFATIIGGRAEGWNIHPEHFSERHALFVIIALGEGLIVAASTVTGVLWTNTLLLVAILAVVITCGLWWSYFPRAKPVLDSALESSQGAEQSLMARDVYSLLHFVMLLGVIAYAYAVEIALAHPGEPLSFDGRIALAAGLVLFVGGMAVAIWRATRKVLVARIVVILGTAVTILAFAGVSGSMTLAVALAGVLLIAVIEQRSQRLVVLADQV